MELSIIIGAAFLALGWPQTSLAKSNSLEPNQIRVYGVVPEKRYIVIDGEGILQEFFSNTDKAVSPSVSIGTLGGPQVPFTPELRAQYEHLLESLQSNKVVSVRARTVISEINYPNFIRNHSRHVFSVTPTRVANNSAAQPYTLSLSF